MQKINNSFYSYFNDLAKLFGKTNYVGHYFTSIIAVTCIMELINWPSVIIDLQVCLNAKQFVTASE